MRKIKNEFNNNNYDVNEKKFILEACFRQFKNDKNFSFPANCYNEYNDLDVDEVLKLMYNDNGALYLLAESLGIETPRYIEVIKEIQVLERNIDIKNTFHDAINLVNSDPGSAIVKARAATVDFINKFSNSNIDDDIKSRLEAHLKDNQIFEPKIDTPVRSICSSLLKLADSIEKIRSEATPAHNNDLIDNKNLAVLCINSCGTLCWFLHEIEQKKEKLNNQQEDVEQNKQEEASGYIDDDVPF